MTFGPSLGYGCQWLWQVRGEALQGTVQMLTLKASQQP